MIAISLCRQQERSFSQLSNVDVLASLSSVGYLFALWECCANLSLLSVMSDSCVLGKVRFLLLR